MNLDRLAAFPAAWIYFGPSRDLRSGPVSQPLLGKRLVAYRTDSGRVVVMDARCPHLGGDLGFGAVRGEAISCPFHHWEFGAAGRCTRIPAGGPIPAGAAVTSYPAEERHGQIWFFNGPRPLHPLPFFAGEDQDAFVAGAPVQYQTEHPWYFYGANGFDTQHMGPLHDRRLVTEPVLEQPDASALRIRYRSEIVPQRFSDRCLKALAGSQVDVDIVAWSATMVLTTARFRRARNWLLFAIQPITLERSRLNIFPMRPRVRGPLALFQPLDLALRRKLVATFFAEDFRNLAGISYAAGTLIEADRILARFLNWVGELPRNEPPSCHHETCELPAGGAAPLTSSLVHGETR
jgi:phenylpropionate dioxygenase-like ring-hydroxylating dioxygenase large terminal subunit